VEAILAGWKVPVEIPRKNPVVEARIEQGVW